MLIADAKPPPSAGGVRRLRLWLILSALPYCARPAGG